VNIVEGGKSDYSIFVDPDALPVTRRAAEDFQLYIRKSTGTQLPIVKATETGGKHGIVIGDGEITRKAGISAGELKPEGFIIKTIGPDLYIVGRDTAGNPESDWWGMPMQAGSWFGVSTFLGNYLNIRWFFPGEYGEYVPPSRDLIIDDINITEQPEMEHRHIGCLYSEATSKDKVRDIVNWERRNKCGWSVVYNGTHSWVEYFRAEDYFKEHPEWFALVNGKRGYEWDPKYGLQMCTTNPEALDKFAEIIIRKCRNAPSYMKGIMFPLSPNDGYGQCECEKCRALDTGVRVDGTRIMTDRYVTYCNEIAKRVNKVLPDQTFGFYGYSFYSDPPKNVKLDPHVKVMHVLNDDQLNHYSDKVAAAYLKCLLAWKEAVGTLYYFSYPEGMGHLALPCMHEKSMKKLFSSLSKAGVTGIYLGMSEPFEATALDNYLYLKMAWRPDADIDKVYEDALTKCYGEKAAPYVKQYFDIIENSQATFADKAKIDLAFGSSRKFPELFDVTYNKLYDEGMPLLKKAAETQTDKNQQYRLQMLIGNLEYCRNTMELYKIFPKVAKTQKPDKKNVLAAFELSQKRQTYLEELGKMELLIVKEQEKHYQMPFAPEIYRSLVKQLEGGDKKAYAQYLSGTSAPLIDGKLDEPFWEKIPAVDISSDKDTGEKVECGATAKVAFDNDYLYIGVYCNEPLVKEIKDSCKEYGGPVWNENEIEVFFDPKGSQSDYKHICVNTLGTIADYETLKGKAESKWNSGAQAAVFKGDKYWSMELKIPLKNLNESAMQPGDIWNFNICRVRKTVTPGQYMCWSPTFGLFGNPGRFGKLIFK